MATVKRPVIPHPFDPSLCLVPLTRGHYATISAVDAGAVGQFNWCVLSLPQATYAQRNRRLLDGRKSPQTLHRFIGELMGLSLSNDVDHENRNGLDCRRSNLRDATRTQNLCNTKLRSDSSSGVKGVCWDRRSGKWLARIQRDGRCRNLGYFPDIESAAEARMEAARQLHGAFASDGVTQWQ